MHFFLMTFSITLQNYNPKGRNVVKMGYKMILLKKHVTTLEVFTTKKTNIYTKLFSPACFNSATGYCRN